MKRNTLNFLVDAASTLVVFGLIATGLVVRFVLPPGSGARRQLWNLTRHEWGDVHYWIVLAGGVLLLAHLALHWQWICIAVGRVCHIPVSAGPPRWRRNLVGIVVVGLVVGMFWGFVELARTAVRESGDVLPARAGRVEQPKRSGDHEDDRGGTAIRGSSTLAEAARTGSMPVELLRSRLGLTERVSADEKLGRLIREHGFSLSQVREIVAGYQRQATTKSN